MMKIVQVICTTILLTTTVTTAQAGPATTTTTVTSTTQASASLHDQNSRIAALESALATLQEVVGTQATQIARLRSKLSAINNSHVMALEPYLTVDTISDNRGPLVTLSGINLQLVNGHGETDSVNGLGNLIIGYDAARNDATYFCSIGNVSDQFDCENQGGIWAVSHKSGSHYLIIGDQNNYSQYGGIVTGYRNSSLRDYASINGGYGNTASGLYSSVSGGSGNEAGGRAASITGGYFNTTSSRSLFASVSGGNANTSDGKYVNISGGKGNIASGIYASISGGNANTASGAYSSVSGGKERSAPSTYNWAAGEYFSDH